MKLTGAAPRPGDLGAWEICRGGAAAGLTASPPQFPWSPSGVGPQGCHKQIFFPASNFKCFFLVLEKPTRSHKGGYILGFLATSCVPESGEGEKGRSGELCGVAYVCGAGGWWWCAGMHVCVCVCT